MCKHLYRLYNNNRSNLVGHPFVIDILMSLTADWWFFGKFWNNKNIWWPCGCKRWWFDPTFKADTTFWSWSFLYYSGRLYWCIQVFIFSKEQYIIAPP